MTTSTRYCFFFLQHTHTHARVQNILNIITINATNSFMNKRKMVFTLSPPIDYISLFRNNKKHKIKKAKLVSQRPFFYILHFSKYY